MPLTTGAQNTAPNALSLEGLDIYLGPESAFLDETSPDDEALAGLKETPISWADAMIRRWPDENGFVDRGAYFYYDK
ncbi:hypothetical protein LCGC14_0428680 [marine sediment metagenome]|uniref:Uncharacterized protein n=1 Tax=marine sediment metagenome TaxID=412755 RepID=A0A0F9VYA9_9ZZZZ